MIKAKFRCDKVEQEEFSETPTLRAVTGGSDENKSFAKYTPVGTLTLRIDNTEAQGFFKPGRDYYLNIEEAPAAVVPTKP